MLVKDTINLIGTIPCLSLPTAYIVRRVCPSIHPFVCAKGGGLPRSIPDRGVPCWGGTPPWVSPIRPGQGGQGVPQLSPARGVPQPGPARGYSARGTPPQVPPIRAGWGRLARGYPAGGYPCWGIPLLGRVPHLGSPCQTWPGGTPTRGIPHFGKQMEYLIRRSRYASYIHAGGLSCFTYWSWFKFDTFGDLLKLFFPSWYLKFNRKNLQIPTSCSSFYWGRVGQSVWDQYVVGSKIIACKTKFPNTSSCFKTANLVIEFPAERQTTFWLWFQLSGEEFYFYIELRFHYFVLGNRTYCVFCNAFLTVDPCAMKNLPPYSLVLFQLWVNNTSAVKLPPSEPRVCQNIWRIWLLPLQFITDPITDKVLNNHEYQELLWLSRKLKGTFSLRMKEKPPKEGKIHLEKFSVSFAFLHPKRGRFTWKSFQCLLRFLQPKRGRFTWKSFQCLLLFVHKRKVKRTVQTFG